MPDINVQAIKNNFVATWTAHAQATGNTATATKAADNSNSHYVTGIAVTAQTTPTNAPDEMYAQILDGAGIIYYINFQSQVIDSYRPGGISISHDFSAPLKITAGNLVELKVVGAGMPTTVTANIWGFTYNP